MVAARAVESNLCSIQHLDEPRGAAIVVNRSNRTVNVIDLTLKNTTTLSEISIRNDSVGSFFDCNRNGSK